MRVLLVEDDLMIGRAVQQALREASYAVDWVTDGGDALATLQAQPYDMLLLDLGLPGADGLDVLQLLRMRGNQVPVLVISARDATGERVTGLDAGADDYLVKPFSLVELDLRLNALLRRSRGEHRASNVLQVGALSFDTGTYQVTREGVPLALTKTGLVILKCLMRESPRLVTRDMLEHAIWGDNRPESDALRTHLHALRQVLDKPFAFPMLRTVPGVGYQLMGSDESA